MPQNFFFFSFHVNVCRKSYHIFWWINWKWKWQIIWLDFCDANFFFESSLTCQRNWKYYFVTKFLDICEKYQFYDSILDFMIFTCPSKLKKKIGGRSSTKFGVKTAYDLVFLFAHTYTLTLTRIWCAEIFVHSHSLAL